MKFQYFQQHGEFVSVQWNQSDRKYMISIFDPKDEPSEIELTLDDSLNDILSSENNKIKEIIRSEVFNSLSKRQSLRLLA